MADRNRTSTAVGSAVAEDGTQERLDAFLNVSLDGFWEWHIGPDHLWLSPRLFEILEYEESDLKRRIKTFESLCHPNDLEKLRRAIRKQLEDASPRSMEIEHRSRTKPGEWKWLRTRAAVAQRDDQGRPLRIVGVVTDLTDRIEAEEELRGHQGFLDEMVAQRTFELADANAELRQDIGRRVVAEDKLIASNKILLRLVDFCRAVAATRSVDEVFTHSIAAVAEIVRSQRVSIMRFDEAHENLVTVIQHGTSGPADGVPPVPVHGSIAGRVAETNASVVINSDAEYDAIREGVQNDSFFEGAPLISTPLGVSERLIGVLNIADRTDGTPYTHEELVHVEVIANFAATAVQELVTRKDHDRALDSIVISLAKLAENRDDDVGNHLIRVTQFSILLAQELRGLDRYAEKINDDYISDLERAVPVHDIGKVGIPDDILLFPGKLSDEKMAVMRTHTTIGAETLQTVIDRSPGVAFLRIARDLTFYHHERFDGSGYPVGLRAHDIPLSARITALADVYDALTTKRVYKPAFSHEKAKSIIVESSGSHFDPEVVDAFIRRETEFADLAATWSNDKDEPIASSVTA